MSETSHLTETDVAIIRALSHDARKSSVLVAKELGLSTKAVRRRVDKLRKENTIFPLPVLNIASIPGLIPIYLSYLYSSPETKTSVDREMVSHFEASYLTGSFADPEIGNVGAGRVHDGRCSEILGVGKVTIWNRKCPSGYRDRDFHVSRETN